MLGARRKGLGFSILLLRLLRGCAELKRLIFVLIGIAALCFGLLVVLDVVSLETARAERWAVIISFAAVVFAVGGLSTAKPSSPRGATGVSDDLAPDDHEARIVPDAPGSLRGHMTDKVPVAEPIVEEPVMEEPAIEEPSIEEPVPAIGLTEPETAEPEIVEPETAERVALVPALLDVTKYSDSELVAIIEQNEAATVQSLVASGELSTSGPLTSNDVATMIFLAYTNEELLTELRLRKATMQPVEISPPSPVSASVG